MSRQVAERPIPFDRHIVQESNAPALWMELFLPRDLWGTHPPNPATDGEFTDIALCYQEGLFQRKVAALTSVLRIALVFNRAEDGGYPKPGSIRSCDVFALAYLTDDLHLDELFWCRDGVRTHSETDLTPIDDVDLDHYANPGQIVRLYNFGPSGKLEDHHYLVCAGEQSDPPQVFFSKPGLEDVGAHTMQSALAMYPSTHMGIVDHIDVVPYSAPSGEPSLKS